MEKSSKVELWDSAFSQIHFVERNDGWLSAERSEAMQGRLKNASKKRLPDVLSPEAGALESEHDDLTTGKRKRSTSAVQTRKMTKQLKISEAFSSPKHRKKVLAPASDGPNKKVQRPLRSCVSKPTAVESDAEGNPTSELAALSASSDTEASKFHKPEASSSRNPESPKKQGVSIPSSAGPSSAGPPSAGPPSAGPPSAGPPSAGPPSAGPPSAGPPSAGPPSAGPPSAGPPSAGPPSAGPPSAGPPSAGPPSAGPPSAGPPSAGPPSAGPPSAGPPSAGPSSAVVPSSVSQPPDDDSSSEETSSDATSSMDQEIRNFRNVSELEKRHMTYLLDKITPVLEKILRFEVRSWRLQVYMRGGWKKRALTHQVFIHRFTTRQHDLLVELFVNRFGAREDLNGDIINQVLMPEYIIRVVMANQGTTYQETDELLRKEARVACLVPKDFYQ